MSDVYNEMLREIKSLKEKLSVLQERVDYWRNKYKTEINLHYKAKIERHVSYMKGYSDGVNHTINKRKLNGEQTDE